MNRGIVPRTSIDVENCKPYLCEPDGDCSGVEGFKPERFIYPCGITAWSQFNDSFKLCRSRPSGDNNSCQAVNTAVKGIAWETDVAHKFNEGKTPPFSNKANLRLDNEHFVVWMRLAAFPSFDKLYNIIEEDLEPGTYYMVIHSSYPVTNFKGTKGFYITNTVWFGAPNRFLGTVYVLVGVLALIITLALLAKHVGNPSAPTNVDPTILLREHLAKFNLESDKALHEQ